MKREMEAFPTIMMANKLKTARLKRMSLTDNSMPVFKKIAGPVITHFGLGTMTNT
jgi:hypothetical protein